MTDLDLAKGYALATKKFYTEGNIRLAAKYWNKIYQKVQDSNIFAVMQLFSDEEVYGITDFIRCRYYLAMGY